MLDDLQVRVLRAVSALPDRPILFGGGAIIAVYIPHRTTHDLDLMWSPATDLGERGPEMERALRADGLSVERIVTSPAFVRLRITSGSASTILDLVAEPSDRPREAVDVDGVDVLVSPALELLTDKLCALLSRQEGRDLSDVRALLRTGESFEESLRRAPELDAGFSPLTLAWVLRSWPMDAVARASGWDQSTKEAMAHFRDELVGKLVERSS